MPSDPPNHHSSRAAGVVFLLAACLSLIPNPGLWLSRFEGWVLFLSIAAIGMAWVAWRLPLFSAWVPILLALIVTQSDQAFALSGGLVMLGLGWFYGKNLSWPTSPGWYRAVGLIGCLWIAWSLYGWWYRSIAPAAEADGFIRFFTPDWPIPMNWGAPDWPLGNQNPLSGFLVMLIPLGIAMTVRERKNKLWRTPWAVGTLILALIWFATRSRAGLIAPVCAGFLAIGMMPSIRLTLARKALIFGSIAALFLTIIAASPGHRSQLFDPEVKAYSDSIRRDFAETGLAMFSKNIWTGVGAGKIPAEYAGSLSSHSDQPGCHQLHSTPIQWLAEFGIPGGLAWIMIAVTSGIALWHSLRTTKLDPLRIGSAIAATGFVAHSLLDYQLYLPVTALVFGLLLGHAWGRPDPDRGSPPLRIGIRCGAAFATFAILARLADGAPPRWFSREAQICLRNGDNKGAQSAWSVAMKLQPSSPVYPALAASFLANQQAPLAQREAADILLERAIENAPRFPYLQVMRGWLWADSQPDRAIPHFFAALKLAPKLPQAWQGLAVAYGRKSDGKSAVMCLAMRGLILPETLYSPDLRSGFFTDAAKPVWAEFRRQVGRYQAQFPKEQSQNAILVEIQTGLDAWEKAGMRADHFIKQKPDWSQDPLWQRMATMDFNPESNGSPPLQSRLLVSSRLHQLLRIEVKDGHAIDWIRQGAANSDDFSGYRVLWAHEKFDGLGQYLGDSTSPMGSLYTVSYDGMANTYVILGKCTTPHLAAKFFSGVLNDLPHP